MKQCCITVIAVILFVLSVSLPASAQYSPEIYQAQKALQDLGYIPGPLDGYWGKATENAVKQFQQDYDIPETGLLDAQTKSKLGVEPNQNDSNGPPERLALVIGNGRYENSPLKNPPNDAADMVVMLSKMGFQVIHKTNADQRTMKRAILEFGKRLRKNGGIGLFYFAGHGMQVDGRNYLIPVNAMIETESDVQFESVDAGRVLGKMEEADNHLNIVILDACRDNPFQRSFRSGNKGLARMDAPRGSLIAYATAPGSTAADGEGRNGIYTKHLLSHMGTPGLKVEEVLKHVRVGVIKESGNKQIPWEASSLTGDFYFNYGRGISVAPTPVFPAPKIAKPSPPEKPKDDLELALLKLKEKKEAERRKTAAELDRFQNLLDDLKKYKQVQDSVLDDATKQSAWKALQRKYPVYSKGAATGDSDILLVNALSKDKGGKLSAIAKKEGFSLTKTNSIGMNFAYIRPGSFMMGSPAGESGRSSDEKRHRVTLTKGLYMQTTEVTQGQWRAVMGSNPSHFSNCGDNCPVEKVSWNDVQEFIVKLNRNEGGNSYRLPTEAEWEYAARAGSTSRFCYGDSDGRLAEHAWYGSNSEDKTQAVAQKKPNAWGLYDMHGNVWEWCQDWYSDYPSGSVTDPTGPSSGSFRVNRGGSWGNRAWSCRSALRGRLWPGYRYIILGFRLALSPGQ